jgi:hypothetical protein
MRTRRTTRRAQVLEAHVVVIGSLLSALARLIHRRCRQLRLAAGPACIRRVSPRAHTIPHTTAHTGTCSDAHTCARLPMSTCGMPAVCLKEALCARGKTHSCAAEPSSNVCIVTPTTAHTQTYPHTHTHSYCNIGCFQYYCTRPQRDLVLLCPVLGPPDTEYLSPQSQLVLVCPY